MKKNIREILDELYESYPSLKKNEQSLISVIETFLKTNVQVLPNHQFKKELRAKLLQSVASSRIQSSQFWQNFKILFGIFATGLAAYGVFSFYYLEIKAPGSIVMPVQNEASSTFLMERTSSGVPQDMSDKKDETLQGGFKEKQGNSISVPKILSHSGKVQSSDNNQIEKTDPLLDTTLPLPSLKTKKEEPLPKFSPQADSSFGGDSSGVDGSVGGQENFPFVDSGLMFSSSQQRIGLPNGLNDASEVNGAGSLTNVPDFDYKITTSNEALKKGNRQTFISKRTSPQSFQNYKIVFNDSEGSFSLTMNDSHAYSPTISIDAENISTPKEIVHQFSQLLRNIGFKDENFDFTVADIEQGMSLAFDETVTFKTPYKLLGKDVYDQLGNKVVLNIVYSISKKEFQFIGPLYHFETVASQLPKSTFFDELYKSQLENSQNLVEIEKEKSVYIKILANNGYQFVPGNIYRVVRKPDGYNGGNSLLYPDYGGGSQPIEIRE